MSSKTAPDAPAPGDVVVAPAGKRQRQRQRRPLSLAIRLAAAYGIAAFVLLWLTCVYGYWSLVRSFEHENYTFLSEEVEEVRVLLGGKFGGAVHLREHLAQDAAAHHASPLCRRAMDPKGEIL